MFDVDVEDVFNFIQSRVASWGQHLYHLSQFGVKALYGSWGRFICRYLELDSSQISSFFSAALELFHIQVFFGG